MKSSPGNVTTDSYQRWINFLERHFSGDYCTESDPKGRLFRWSLPAERPTANRGALSQGWILERSVLKGFLDKKFTDAYFRIFAYDTYTYYGKICVLGARFSGLCRPFFLMYLQYNPLLCPIVCGVVWGGGGQETMVGRDMITPPPPSFIIKGIFR